MPDSPEIVPYELFREESFKAEENMKKQKARKNSIINYFKVESRPEEIQIIDDSEPSEDDEVTTIDDVYSDGSDDSCIIAEGCLKLETNISGEESGTVSSRPVRQASINARKAIQDIKSFVSLHSNPYRKNSKNHIESKAKNKSVEPLAPIFIKKNVEKPTLSKEKQSFLFSGLPEVVKKAQHAMLSCDSDSLYHSCCVHYGKDENLYSSDSYISFNRTLDSNISYCSRFSKELNCYFNKSADELSQWPISVKISLVEFDIPQHYKYLFELWKGQIQETSESPCEELSGSSIDVVFGNKKRKISLSRQRKKRIKQDPEYKSVTAPLLTNLLWVDKYNPRVSSEVVGNIGAVKTIKTWLQEWKLKCEVESRIEMSSGESDFSGDEDQLVNSIVLVGPAGVGKTSLVYALGEELGFEVFEVNYSTSRSDKQILQDLKEATQSHQIRTSKGTSLFTNNKSSSEASVESHPYSLILFDEVDLSWEDPEDGFLRSVHSFMESSKRPVILTCNKYYPLKSGHDVFYLEKPSEQDILPYLTTLCRLEGKSICPQELSQLISVCKGDIRKTILETQAWSSLYHKNQDDKGTCNLKHVSPFSLLSLQNTIQKLCPLEHHCAYVYQKDIIFINLERFLKYPLEELKLVEPDFTSRPARHQESDLNISWASCESDIFCTESDGEEEPCKTTTHPSKPTSLQDTKLEWLTAIVDVLSDQSHADILSNIVDTIGAPYDYAAWISLYSIGVSNNRFPTNLPSDIKLPVPGFDQCHLQRVRPVLPIGNYATLLDQLPIHLQGTKNTLYEDYLPYLSAISRAESARMLQNDKRRSRSNYLKEKGFDIDNQLNKKLCDLFFDVQSY